MANTPTKRTKKEPQVGIFWLIGGELLVDGTPLGLAEPYRDFLTHPRGHVAIWEQYQRNGTVPPETEYEELPLDALCTT
jgi:hypothetical protein